MDQNSDCVQVALRVRDLVPSERLEGFFSCIHVSGNAAVVGGERSFGFDFAFGPDSTQTSVYDSSVKPLIESALSGINVTVLAYGQTGSGKTHTMGTDGLLGKSPEEYGVVPRIACDVFQACKEMVGVSIVVSALEIYGEELRDLISDDSKTRLQIREDRSGQITVFGLQEVTVSSKDELLEVLGKGLLRRATGSTNMNAASSRSHALCTITLQSPAPPSTTSSPCKYTSPSQSGAMVYSKIQLVDLAGSERLTQTLSKTTKETCQINRGLHALSNVIMALSTPNASGGPSPHVPYRDSKLTRVLQDSLGGSARTLMIACVSAADESVQESLSTLQYATRARRIRNQITATALLEPPTDDSIVNLQWTLLRKYLSSVGLMPIPEVLMQDLHGKGDEETRVALLRAANKFFPDSSNHPTPASPALHTLPRSSQELQQLSTGGPTGCSSPGALPPSQALVPLREQATSGRLHALSEPGCSPGSATAPPSKPLATRASVCSVDTASQTAPEDSIDVIATPEKGTAITRTSNGHATCDLRDTGGPQPYDIAQKYLQSQQDATELYGSFGWRAGRPNALAQGDELEDFAPEAEHSILSPNATEYCDWSERYSHSDPFGLGKDIVVFDEEQASYISSTDYSSAIDIAGHHARLLAEHEGAALAAADTQNRLLEAIRELEAAVMFQEGELQAARDVEARACIERDDAQRACAQLQYQIDLQQHELEDLHKGMRELEATLGRSKAEKADARTLYEERVHAANARKNALERQLRSQAAAASEGAAAAPKIRELSQNLDKLQASKANAVRELRSCQMEHKQREAKMQAQLVALQRRLRGSERRAAVLQQDKSRTATVLQRKDQQLQDSKQALQSLQVSLEASEKRAAAANPSTPPDKGTRRQRSQDGSCVSSKSIASDTAESTVAQKTAWWDEQISLLAQRLSAGKRAEQLQQRLADVSQQISAAQQSVSPENKGVLEDLRLQQHVLQSSLAVGRERAASSTLIQRNLQHAANTLPPPAVRKLLLHLVSSTLSAYTAACSSRAEAHHLRSSLDRTSKLNELLTVQVASSNGASALFYAATTPQAQAHAAYVSPTVGSPRRHPQPQPELGPCSPHRVRVMQDVGAAHSSPAAVDCADCGKQAALETSVNHPAALSADNLVMNAGINAASPSTYQQVLEAPRPVQQPAQENGVSQGSQSMQSSSSSRAEPIESVSLSANHHTTTRTDELSAGPVQLQTGRFQIATTGAFGEQLPEMPTHVGAEQASAFSMGPTRVEGSERRGSSMMPATESEYGARPTTPVAGLQTHSMQPTQLQSHAIMQSTSFRSTDFNHLSMSGPMSTTHRNDVSVVNGSAYPGVLDTRTSHRDLPTATKLTKQVRPRSATPRRVSFADEQGWTPRNATPAASSPDNPGTSATTVRRCGSESPIARAVRTDLGVHSSYGSMRCTEYMASQDPSGTATMQSSLVSPRSRKRSYSVGELVGHVPGGRSDGRSITSAGSLSAFKVRDNPVAAESEGMIDSRYKPIAFPAGPDLSGISKSMLEQRPAHAQDDLTTPVKRFGTTSSASKGGREHLRFHVQQSPGHGGELGILGSPVAATSTPHTKRAPSPWPVRTPPAKVQAYRKKLQELQARSAEAGR